MFVAVISSIGTPLMPTNIKRMRKLVKAHRAKIVKHKPILTIQLLDRSSGDTQPIEYKCDTGYQHIGISICSEKHEYVSQQRDLLKDETEKHNDQRKCRRTRRNRKRYRKPRFDNRTHGHNDAENKWFAPSIRNKLDQHVQLFNAFKAVMPITTATFEMGQFDTQLLKAIEKGDPIPESTDYQHGERYGIATLREAVFTRDEYKCQCCGRTIKDGAILHTHHIGFWKHDRTNRMSNLLTICEKCHTPENHQPDGKLYGLKPELNNFKGATFMSTVKWEMLKQLKAGNTDVKFHITYGAKTKCNRHDMHIAKSHANDAYAMGTLHPKHRTRTTYWQKQRRNNRVLQTFTDATYIDGRDGTKKKGKDLTNGRISRNHKKDHENLHCYRSRKVKKGHRSIRRGRTQILPGTIVKLGGEMLVVKGLHNGKNVEFVTPSKDGKKSADIKKVEIVRKAYNTGWVEITESEARQFTTA